MDRSLLVFLHLAKTGGRTVDTVLRNTFGPAYVQAESLRPHRPVGLDDDAFIAPVYTPADLDRLHRHCPWLRAVGGHTLTLDAGFHRHRPVRYLAFLREPLARGASHFQYHQAATPHPLDWDRWCAWREHHNHQTRFFAADGDPRRAMTAIEEHGVFVGLLEKFEESLLLARRLVAPELHLAYHRSNTAGDNSLARELLADAGARDRLQAMYAADIPLYAWVRDHLWPRYEAAYGPDLADHAALLRQNPSRGFRRLPDLAARIQHRFWIEPWVARQRRRP